MATYDPMQIAGAPIDNTVQPATPPKAPASALPIAPPRQPTGGPTDLPAGPAAPPANPVTPPPLSTTDPLAFTPPASSGLPPGFSLGSGAQYGNAFMNGQQLNGLVADNSSPTGYSYSFANGTTQPGATQDAWQNIIGAENQNYFNQGGAGNPAAGAMVQASMPLNGGLNGSGLPNDPNIDTAFSPAGQLINQGITPSAAQIAAAQPGGVTPTLPGANASAAPSAPPLTTYNPMQIAGTAPAATGTDAASAPPASGTPSGGAASQPGATGSNPLGYNLNPTDPNNALTAQTITPSGTDFASKAQQLIDATNAASQPQFEANLRDANRYAFGSGQGYSGIENTSLGDIVANRTLQQEQLAQQLGYNALGQQNANQYANIGIAQQQQGFQNQQQQEAFNQAMQQLGIGSSGSPSDIALVLSQIFGSQGSNAANAASNYVNQNNQANGSQASNAQLMAFIQAMQNGGSTSGVGTTSPIPPATYNPIQR